MKQVILEEWLDSMGFGIFQEIQGDGSDGEFILARAIVDNGRLIVFEEFGQSKFKYKLDKKYQQQLNTNEDIIMNIEETLKGLTIRELESLKPSYYNLAIDAKIAELKAKKEAREKKNAERKTRDTIKDK
jgi:hypothetical protein